MGKCSVKWFKDNREIVSETFSRLRHLEHKSGKRKAVFTAEFNKEMSERAQMPESKVKRKQTFKSIGHQKGNKNSQYGTRWIYNLDEKRSIKINRNDPLPPGWNEGRKIKFE